MKVCMIYSKLSISQILTFLRKYEDCKFLRCANNATPPTIMFVAVLKEETFEKLKIEGYQNPISDTREISISSYILKAKDYPAENQKCKYYIPIPIQHCKEKITHDEVISVIESRLKILAEFKILENNCWEIKVPVVSNENLEIRGGCFVSFKSGVKEEKITLAKILLTKTKWGTTDLEFKCYWANANNVKKPGFFDMQKREF